MLPIRVKACSESDLRMLGNLAHNIQRVLPVTQADIDAAAALGKGWVVWKVIEVNDPLDNLRGGTQLVIKQNSITPGQNVRRVLIASGPGGETVVIRGSDYIILPDAIADSLSYVKAFGGTEQRNIPDNYLQRQFIYMMEGSYIKVEDLPISAGYRVEFDFQTLTLPSPLRNFIGGRSGGAAGGGFRLSKLADGDTSLNRVVLYGFEAGTEYYDPTAQFQANTRYKYTYNNGVCTLESGGSVVSTKTFTVTDDTSTDWGINAYVNGTSWQTNAPSIYVYSVKVWNTQGELVMDLVPAVQRGTVPVVGFYDAATGGFRTATDGTFAAGGEAVPTPDAPMDIVSNNGVLKYGKPIMLDSTRYYAYLAVNLTDWSYSSDSYSIPIPVTVGHKYKITVPTTNPLNGAQNTIFRYAFTDSINTDWTSSTATGQTSIPAYDMVRTNPQDTPSVEITATHPYMIIQMGANVFSYILANNLITITDQSIYTDGTVETIEDTIGNTATAEMLLKVGTYQDVQSIIDGVVTRKVGVKVLDGTEDWQVNSAANKRFYIQNSAFFTDWAKGFTTGDDPKLYCTHWPFDGYLGSGGQSGSNIFNAYLPDTGTCCLRFTPDTLGFTTTTEWSNWLADQYAAGTPVTIIYPLAQEVTEQVTPQVLNVQTGNNTLEITQASMANLELEAKYQKSA